MPEDLQHSRLEWARLYRRMGWIPIPLRPRDKRPLVSWESYCSIAPTDEEITTWFTRLPAVNIGIITGASSGLIVLDVDPAHGGNESLSALEQQHGPLEPTVQALTGGGGRHFYFRHPGFSLRNRAGIAPGLDIRGDGGYVVAPPSIHLSGKPYAWVEGRGPDSTTLASMPMWLIELASRGRPAGRGHPLAYWRDLTRRGVSSGERNNTIASLTGHLLWHGVDPAIILDLLLCWNAARCRPPLSEDEVARTVESIVRTHERHGDEPAQERS